MVKVLKFGASWCGPCRMMAPTIKALIEKYADNENVEILEVDVDENPELAAEHGIRNVPTMIFLL